MAGEVEKINVRSPYYLTVDSQGSPSSGEPVPPEYDPPSTLTQPLECGNEVNVGEDVGTRIYEVDATNRSGTFTLSYTIYTPVKITYQFTEDASPTVVGYRGGDVHEQELIDMGIPASELTGLVSGEFDNAGIPIVRSTDTASTLTITVEAPLQTDNYRLVMGCPDETAAPVSTFSLPATPPTNTDLLDGSQTLALAFLNQTSGILPVSPIMKVYINDSLVQTLSPASFGYEDKSQVPTIIFSGVSGLSWASVVNPFNKTPVIVDNSSFISGDNRIGISLEWDTDDWGSWLRPKIDIMRTGIFRNTTANEYQFAYYEYQGTFSFYGATDRFDTEVNAIGTDLVPFESGKKFVFNYNTTTRTVSNITLSNAFPDTAFTISPHPTVATGGIKI